MPSLSPAGRGHLAMLCFGALIGGSFSLGGDAAPYIEPGAFNVIRFVFAFIVAAIVAGLMGKLSRKSFEAPWRFLVLGGLFAIYFVTMFEALKTTTPLATSAVFTLTPLIAAAIGAALLGQSSSMRTIFPLLIGAVGALWVIFRGDLQALIAFDVGRGEIIFFFGCIAHAIYPTATRILTRGEPSITINVGMLGGGLIVLVAYSWGEVLDTDLFNLPAIVWIAILYSSVFSGVTTFTLLQFSALHLPASKVMAYTYLVPIWVVLWEMARGTADAPPSALVGLVLVVVALGLLLRD